MAWMKSKKEVDIMKIIEGTGVYIRTNEDGKWDSKDIAVCKEETQRAFLKDKDKEWLESLVMLLLKQKITEEEE